MERKRRKINGGTTSKPPYFDLKIFFLVFFSAAKQNSGVILALPTLVSTSTGFSFLFRFMGKESHPIMWLQQMPFNPYTDDYKVTGIHHVALVMWFIAMTKNLRQLSFH
ncbi:hypothetical protein Dsin_024362 [Dipteronia sinensis]|uniref:Uncharacterized protein n=1 Tax=Dipteronia sinensis TaxID=43782 RepID=A0AAE0DVZ7_9ROSI|nr:hypothetical protein Dsin_024362 [Dipteronia sinensis]